MLAHENPFRAVRIEALRYRGVAAAPAELLARCRRHAGRGALVGPKGSGKTTLLEALADELHRQGQPPLLVLLNQEDHRVDWGSLRQGLDTATPPPLLVDGAEQLGTLAWLRLRWMARRAPLFIVTTHRPGRLPLLHRHATSPELLVALVEELLRGTVPTLPRPSAAQLHALFVRCEGNLRECFRHLYDDACVQG